MRNTLLLAAAGLVTALATAGASITAAQVPQMAALPVTAPLAPADNPTTPDRVALGRLLFWDPILSGQKDVACATCHHPDFGYSDGLALSLGANGVGLGPSRTFADGHPSKPVKRNSQSILNVAFNGLAARATATAAAAPMFWDLRVQGLEAQALEPLKAADEMRGDAFPEDRSVATVVARLNALAEYRRLFTRAFGGTAAVTEQNLGRALAAFQRTLVAMNSPFDRYMRGDTTALNADQLRGMDRFSTAGCVQCHNGPMFSDFTAHVLGVPDNTQLTASDAGVNKTYAFRTPSLRNLGVTAPYMHNGAFATLPQVINFYQRVSRGGGRGGRGGGDGGRAQSSTNPHVGREQIDPLARGLRIGRRGQRDLIAFLDSLNDPNFDRVIPARVPSGLPVGGKLTR